MQTDVPYSGKYTAAASILSKTAGLYSIGLVSAEEKNEIAKFTEKALQDGDFRELYAFCGGLYERCPEARILMDIIFERTIHE